MPRILVSNDDGIAAPGLAALVEAVSVLGEVLVCAPDRERSGSSHAITFHTHLRVHKNAAGWWSVSGTPVDCVYIAMNHLCEGPVDLVVSGINAGFNLGTDVFYSGTVGAAAEGHMQGIPALAVSTDRAVDPRVAIPAVRTTAAALLAAEAPAFFNVNVPRPPGLASGASDEEVVEAGAALPLEVTRMGVRRYQSHVEERRDPMGRAYYWIGGPVLNSQHTAGEDTHTVSEGRVAVTPLELDITGADPALAQRILGTTALHKAT